MASPPSSGTLGTLRRDGDQLVYRYPPGTPPPAAAEPAEPDGFEARRRARLAPDEVAVRAVWARPLTGRLAAAGDGEGGGEVSLRSADKKTEVAWIPDPAVLDPESRALLLEELDAGVVLPRITRVLLTTPRFGHRYWNVETDRGPIDFLSRSPETNVTWLDAKHCLIRDVLGNAFEIPDLDALDPESRAQALRAL